MYPRSQPITPSQEAANGALAIFVDGCRNDDIAQQLFGLTVLSSATEAQVSAAMSFVEVSRQTTVAEIQALLARD
jgi:hypothetical protein